jgi:hypothetical protein
MPGDFAIGDTTHEWMSFKDPEEERTWMIDVTFLESAWTCIFGQGCQGVLTGPAPELVQGCCSYGAHFSSAEDIKRVEKAAARLTAEQWQFKGRAAKGGIVSKNGKEKTTRLVKGACIFLNRPGFAAGPGCALHSAAVQAGVAPLRWKPDVCWQLPLRRQDLTEDGGHVVSVIMQWDRRHWGEAGEEFHWWCTEAPEAFVDRTPLYKRVADELIELCGQQVYDEIVTYLDARGETLLPHPVVRRRDPEVVDAG